MKNRKIGLYLKQQIKNKEGQKIIAKLFNSEIGAIYKIIFAAIILGCLFSIIGGFLNTLVITLNGGKMPVITAPPYISEADIKVSKKHCVLTSKTKLPFLADTVIIAKIGPTETMNWTKVVSIGDIFLYFGTLIVFVSSFLFLIFSKLDL